MSKIEYLKDAEDAISKAAKQAERHTDGEYREDRFRVAHELGMIQYEFKALARRAELDSQLPQIRERIASTMTFGLDDAALLIDAIAAGLKRQYEESTEIARIHLGDAAQDLQDTYDEFPAQAKEAIDAEEARIDAKHRAAAQREVA